MQETEFSHSHFLGKIGENVLWISPDLGKGELSLIFVDWGKFANIIDLNLEWPSHSTNTESYQAS